MIWFTTKFLHSNTRSHWFGKRNLIWPRLSQNTEVSSWQKTQFKNRQVLDLVLYAEAENSHEEQMLIFVYNEVKEWKSLCIRLLLKLVRKLNANNEICIRSDMSFETEEGNPNFAFFLCTCTILIFIYSFRWNKLFVDSISNKLSLQLTKTVAINEKWEINIIIFRKHYWWLQTSIYGLSLVNWLFTE